MCCRTKVFPLHPDIAIAILKVGQFVPAGADWERYIPEEGCSVRASLVSAVHYSAGAGNCLDLRINPPISAFPHHFGKRVTAGVYFEIAAKYAEKVDGEVMQQSNVTGCHDGTSVTSRLLARYPDLPLLFERACPGFQAVLLGEQSVD